MSTPCAACKYLRRRCTQDCVFAPYFPANKQDKYASVHKVFGASHVATLLNELHPSQRETAMNTLAFEAQARLLDPVFGCTRLVHNLQHQLRDLEGQLQVARNELASYNINVVPTLEPPPPVTYQQNHHNPTMMSDYGGDLASQQFRQLHEEARRFASARTAQVQQTPVRQTQQTVETQTQQNAELESDVCPCDKKI